MLQYPELTGQQQERLPVLLRPARAIPAKFEDSTHRLWLCETVNGPLVLKVCNQQSIQQSRFWLGMNCLFDLNFPHSLENIADTHHFLSQYCPLSIPHHIASEASSFVLSTLLDGEDVDADWVTDDIVKQLAEHLGQLHQQSFNLWGSLHQPKWEMKTWAPRLQQAIYELLEAYPTDLPMEWIEHALKQATQIEIESVVPIMPDLRWDQLLHQQGDLSALVDLDAFVLGPRELELTILEYQLTATQADLFKQHYQHYLPFPDLSSVRLSYRLLFFLMNALGERNLEAWMQHPTYF